MKVRSKERLCLLIYATRGNFKLLIEISQYVIKFFCWMYLISVKVEVCCEGIETGNCKVNKLNVLGENLKSSIDDKNFLFFSQ